MYEYIRLGDSFPICLKCGMKCDYVIDTFQPSEVAARFGNASVVETKLRINQNILKFVAQLVFLLKMAQQMSSLRRRG